MPRLDGFEVMELLDPSIAVVLVTAYDQYAVKAFEVEAVDYVLKPFRPERLLEALARARERARQRRRPDPAKLSAALRPAGTWASRLAVRDGADVHVIPIGKLDYVEAQDDGVVVKSEGKTYRKAQTLASLAETLDPSALPARAPVLSRGARPHPARRALLEEQPRGDPRRRDAHPGEPRGPRAAQGDSGGPQKPG